MTSSRVCHTRSVSGLWVAVVATAALLFAAVEASAQGRDIRVLSDGGGARLQVDGRDFMVRGMNWDYFPIGQNYSYSLWTQPDDVIEAALAREMPLLKSMGVNTIRQYAGVPPQWVQHIYERYGIWTVLNHPMGRYGVTVDGVWVPSTNYADPRTRAMLIAEVEALVDQFRGVPGVLMWLLGNENNYGLAWAGAETENLPEGERDAARARYLYSLFGEVIQAIKAKDNRPVAMANGDLQYIDIIAQETRGLDVFGTNVYRGISFGDAFQVVKDKLNVPIMFTEFGADAWNAKDMREDQVTQARYLLGQWKEIYEESAGKGLVGNAIGGFTFQWSDGWWKYLQENNLSVHDINASWSNDAYPEDYSPGDNNMNEEWWGIMAKGRPDTRGLFELYPRAAYYALRQAYRLDPYAPGTDLATIRAHFAGIDPAVAALQARGDQAALRAEESERLSVSGLRLEFETFSTGGSRLSTPETLDRTTTTRPAFRGFDHLQSFYADFSARPAGNVTGMLSVNLLGHVPLNPIDEIFYENRGRPRRVQSDGETIELNDIERLKVYRASVSWDDRWFKLDGFYRTGHYHWGYEGDFFGLYREANYGPNIDIYNAETPLGFELAGKRVFDGFKFALGPELWWGANPAFLAKYRRRLGPFEMTGIYQEDLAQQATTSSSIAIPVPKTRKATLHLAATTGQVGVEVGGIWSGDTKVGDTFQLVDGSNVLQDRIRTKDTFGGKAKVTITSGRWNWYVQGAVMGLVADGGPTQTLTFTGWGLKDSGNGNQYNVLTGGTLTLGSVQIAPNFLWQKPIVGPIPSSVAAPGRPRNILDDPFAVRANRETVGGELLIAYDPTPATWMWAWDNDVREDASFAASFGVTYRHQPTTLDAGIGILADGRTTFPFPGAVPPKDVWEARARMIMRLAPDFRVIANLLAGTGQPNGDDDRLIRRYAADLRMAKGQLKILTSARFNDWGPYDYHRDFNLTFPVQLMGDVSTVLGLPEWFDLPQTRFGVRGTWRSLDQYSPRYCPARVAGPGGTLTCDPTAPGPDGQEWEIRTYLHLAL